MQATAKQFVLPTFGAGLVKAIKAFAHHIGLLVALRKRRYDEGLELVLEKGVRVPLAHGVRIDGTTFVVMLPSGKERRVPGSKIVEIASKEYYQG
ncbi:hypothetical protein KC902_01885 [Candidatus Kaiserbacteria bacterium]|nr:hypothetical protein [Candidatus Kaiserbacteria bacterium]USN88855.1 MAG: hypothetical protein H6780_00315 [Candidatus Nomurabacteria bacterium]